MAIRIIAVNDDRDLLKMLSDVLSECGYEVVTHTDVERALIEAHRFKPDVLIVDSLFGKEELGLHALQKLKLNRATATRSVIVCSAASQRMRELEPALRTKGIAIVHKPFLVDELLAVIETVRNGASPPTG